MPTEGMPFYLDWTMLLLIPPFLLSLWAQRKIKKSFNTYSRIGNRRNITGAKAARLILDTNGIHDVKIEAISGNLTDHYDPRNKTVRLSEGVYNNTSIAAIGVAAHEVGHAIQHNIGYVPIKIRNFFVPIAKIGSFAAIPLLIAGMIFTLPILVNIGIGIFSGIVVFHLITLPVEINASKRALAIINSRSLLEPDEAIGAKKVLTAAALTYMAAALMSMMNLLRLILISRRR